MSIIERFAKHPLAANLLMIILFVLGAFGASKLNTQFLPPFQFKIITVNTIWPGASPEDVERSVTAPLEQSLRNVDFLSEMTSTSAYGVSSITLEFDYSTDLSTALDKVKEEVNQVDTLPTDSDPPIVSEQIFYELIATVVVSGFDDLGEARRLTRNLEQSLLDSGIAKVDVRGLPEEELAIQVPANTVYELKQSLDTLGQTIRRQSQDAPAGTLGRNTSARQIRTEEQRREAQPFDSLIVNVDEQGRMLQLGEIADVTRRAKTDEPLIFNKGKPAVELKVFRVSDSDALINAEILDKWVQQTRPTLPQGLTLKVIDERWTYIAERINLLLENGASGLILVVLVLYLFLNSRVAFWVAAGIPTVFLATLFIMFLVGESLNMLSLFGLIMVLGIVVDDAIVVGEEALSEFEQGKSPLEASVTAAKRMAAPVISSSLTTVAAFMPLLLLTDLLGEVLFSIPLVVIVVLMCSLFEAFFILPGHLYHALKKPFKKEPKWRERFEYHFEHFKAKYKKVLENALHHRRLTYSITASFMVLMLGLVMGGRVPFTFFPSPEAGTITAYVQFVAGTPPDRVKKFLLEMEEALFEAEASFKEELIVEALVYQNLAFSENTMRNERGSEFGTIFVELTQPDSRDVRNPQFIERWQSFIGKPPYIESLNIESPKSGPPGVDIDVQLTGADPEVLKAAALDLRAQIARYVGVFNVEDDLPFGRTQWILTLTPQGRLLGLTTDDIARQLRAALEGYTVQNFYDREDEIEVKVMLPDNERFQFARFESFPIITPQGEAIPLANVATVSSKVGMQALRHTDTRLAVHVTAEVDTSQSNANRVLSALAADVMPGIAQRYGVSWSFEGVSADEEHTLGEMQTGAVMGFVMIYLILCWILSSYTWSFIVLAAIPFGLAGAILGHLLLGIDLTLLSLFGLFGLAGVVINDSIILILTYFRTREEQGRTFEAIIDAATHRLRPILLTSLTTVGGLLPLLFETSLQAQFLIPMAASMTFGLLVSTPLVLLVIPCMIASFEKHRRFLPKQFVKARRKYRSHMTRAKSYVTTKTHSIKQDWHDET